MSTLIFAHDDSLGHAVPPGHPERPDRYATVRDLLDRDFPGLPRADVPLGTDEHVLLAHSESHLRHVRDVSPKDGFRSLDPDTVMSPGTLAAAMRAVGAAVTAVDKVAEREADNAFVAMRPPGHHAEQAQAMGFCVFANAAIAALHARARHGIARVAVLDFDVHHGNGTQAIFWDDPDLLLASTHQMPLYPGTGARNETGKGGNIRNVPLRAGMGGRELLDAWRSELLPAVRKEAPELVIVSAGFDAHRADPLAGLNVEAEDFGELTAEIAGLADEVAGGRLVSFLEGGYDLDGLRESVAAHLSALSGKAP